MALIVLTSAQGSPGVTTTALGLALVWPRPVLLIDADPTGASAIPAGFFRGGDLPSNGTVLDLAMSHRHGTLTDDLPHTTMQIPDTAATFLPGVLTHAQAGSLTSLWEPLGGELRALERTGQDVIVDAGRLGLTGSPEPLIRCADLTLLVTRSHLPALVGARSWAETLLERVTAAGAVASLGVLVIGQGQPYAAREITKVLGVPVTAAIAWDPVSAEVLSRGAKPPRRFESSALSKSLRAAASETRAVLTTNAALTTPPGSPT